MTDKLKDKLKKGALGAFFVLVLTLASRQEFEDYRKEQAFKQCLDSSDYSDGACEECEAKIYGVSRGDDWFSNQRVEEYVHGK